MTDLSLKINGIHCEHCVMSIKEALQKIEGIENIEMSVDYKYISIRIDEKQVSKEKIEKIIDELGFEVV